VNTGHENKITHEICDEKSHKVQRDCRKRRSLDGRANKNYAHSAWRSKHTYTHPHTYICTICIHKTLTGNEMPVHTHIPKDISAPKQTHQLMHNYTYRVVTAMPISSTSSMALGDPQSKPQKERIVIPQNFEKFDFVCFFSHLDMQMRIVHVSKAYCGYCFCVEK
jgi:hypothetical protein